MSQRKPKRPRRWMPLSDSAFISKTWGLSVEEVGAFCLIWAFLGGQGGSYPLDEASIARLCNVSPYRWRKLAPRVMKFFTYEAGILSLPKRKPGRKAIPMALQKLIFGRDGHKCRYCGRTDGTMHIDHVVPVSLGGGDEPENLCVACAPCNHSKHATPLSEWRQ